MRLIDGDKLQEFPIRANRCDKEHANTHFINGVESVMEYAEMLPTVDAEVVVRCKDCKHYRNHPNGLCYLHTEPKENARGHSGNAVCVEPEDFCSYGERKDGGAK